jgi:hypothetical protein
VEAVFSSVAGVAATVSVWTTFTLKNPHNVSGRRFALKAEEKEKAICCDSRPGPHLNFTSDFGRSYTNDTELDGKTFFTGWVHFTVKEIEVFEIIDQTIPFKSCSPALPKLPVRRHSIGLHCSIDRIRGYCVHQLLEPCVRARH